MTHLEVKPDGLIYVIKDCPEEPNQHTKYYWQVNKFERAKRDYQQALASCERIECADQEQAKRLIWRYCNKLASNGIYSIPVEWDKIERQPCIGCSTDCYNYQMCDCKNTYAVFKQQEDTETAILKESTPSTEQESQEELWFDVARTMDAHSEMHRIPILIKQFTITRKK